MKEPQPGSNIFCRFLDTIQECFTKTENIDPNTLFTKNRLDIDLRIKFLHDVLEGKIPRKETMYYQFIADGERGTSRNSEDATTEFLKVYDSIKQNGIQKPLIAGRFEKGLIKIRYIINNKKVWKDYKNESGLQLIDGAHRLAIALYLKNKSIPVKILKPYSFQVPDYDGYIQIKQKKYLENIRDSWK